MDEQTRARRAQVLKNVKASRKGKLRLVAPVDPDAMRRAREREHFQRVTVGKVGERSASLKTRYLGLHEAADELATAVNDYLQQRHSPSGTVEADTLELMAVLCIEMLREARLERYWARKGRSSNGGSVPEAADQEAAGEAAPGSSSASTDSDHDGGAGPTGGQGPGGAQEAPGARGATVD